MEKEITIVDKRKRLDSSQRRRQISEKSKGKLVYMPKGKREIADIPGPSGVKGPKCHLGRKNNDAVTAEQLVEVVGQPNLGQSTKQDEMKAVSVGQKLPNADQPKSRRNHKVIQGSLGNIEPAQIQRQGIIDEAENTESILFNQAGNVEEGEDHNYREGNDTSSIHQAYLLDPIDSEYEEAGDSEMEELEDMVAETPVGANLQQVNNGPIRGDRADRIVKKLGFNNWIRVEASGFAGGIWILWNDYDYQIDYLNSNTQFIHVRIKNPPNNDYSLLTVVYGETRQADRASLWDSIRHIAHNSYEPWLVLGDFNAYLSPSDKRGGSDPDTKSMMQFKECINDAGLLETSVKGYHYTWEKTGLQERLDWVFHNGAWERNFPNTSAYNGLKFKSDHRIVVVKDQEKDPPQNNYQKKFSYQAAWNLEKSFTDVISNAWRGKDWIGGLNCFTQEAMTWNKNHVGDISKKKLELIRRLEGIKRKK